MAKDKKAGVEEQILGFKAEEVSRLKSGQCGQEIGYIEKDWANIE